MFDKPNICSACGGKCCKASPGAAFPQDFDNDIRKVEAALNTGRWALDCWDGDPRPYNMPNSVSLAYYVRPAIVKHEGERWHRNWGGSCTFYKPELGCELASDARPTNCKQLEPVDASGKHCMLHDQLNHQKAAIAWLPYTQQLKELRNATA